MKFTHADHFNVGWLYIKRKPWLKQATYFRRDRMVAWTPSPAAQLGKRITIRHFIFTVEAHGVLLLARKPWVHKHSGFRKRTHPEEYRR